MDNVVTNNPLRIWSYLLLVIEGLLVLFAVARLMSTRRQPTNTLAWLLVIILLPWLGVPLFFIFGSRKLRRLVRRKRRIAPLPFPPEGIRDGRTAHLVAATGAGAPVGGNRVRLLADGTAAFSTLEEQIRQARHSIHITTFILGRDETGNRLVRLLAQKARQGVQVRVVMDSMGSFGSGYLHCNTLRRAGAKAHRFMPIFPLWSPRTSANLRNHRKMAIFDGHTAIMGGHNLAREYMGPTHYRRRWRDMSLLIEGPGVEALNEIFLADWAFASGEHIPLHNTMAPRGQANPGPGESSLQMVASGPDVDGDPLYETILSMIQEAKHSIWIVTPYFIPDEVLLRSLMVKAKTGHEVVLITPLRSDNKITDFARRHYLDDLQAAGARVYLYGQGMVHSKALVVDDKLALMGSANFDIRSLFVNFEIGVVLHSAVDVREVKAHLEHLRSQCGHRNPRRRARFLGRLAEDLSRLLAPLL